MSNLAERNSDWIQTYTGRQFWPLDPRPEDVSIEDIAHALSMMCRFTGHCKEFYSVAQHSVHVMDVVRSKVLGDPGCNRTAMWALLHDASEAYMHDLPRPLKRAEGFGEMYKAHELRLMRVICDRFELSHDEPPVVKEADTILLLTEQRDLMGRQAKPWKDVAQPLAFRISGWTPETAERRFRAAFCELMGVHGA